MLKKPKIPTSNFSIAANSHCLNLLETKAEFIVSKFRTPKMPPQKAEDTGLD
jgi:hypothetical protein